MRTANPWSAAPVARLLFPFCLGITWLFFFPGQSFYGLAAGAGIGGIGFFISNLFFPKLGYKGRGIPALFLFTSLCFSGAALTWLGRTDRQPDFFSNHLKPESVLTVRLTEPVQDKEKSFKAVAEVVSVSNGQETMAVAGNILLYFFKTENATPPAYGDVLLLRNVVKPLEPPRNPGEFDYSAHMAIRHVYHSAWLYPGQWKPTGLNQAKPVWGAILSYRDRLEMEIESLIKSPDDQSIAKAILLGDDKELDPQMRAAYTGTGTLHVLSVSGMHVGILFIALRFLLSFLLGARIGRITRIFILLMFLWGYSLLTGLSPSVARSAAMLSLVLIGLEYKGTTSIYNIIAASAFGLLLTDPYLLAHVSFQLSYAAVLGIIWLQPKIVKRWEPKKWFLKQGWEIIAASIAAQITTLPLALLYFNQFPSYFLLSNLVIIPISSLVLFIGSAWLVLASIPGISLIASWVGYITYGLIIAMNWCAKFLASFPFATVSGLYIDKLLFVVLGLGILLACLAIQHRRKALLWAAASFAVFFFSDLLYLRYEAVSSDQLTIHAISKEAVLSFRTGDKLYMLGDSTLKDPDMQKYHFQGYANSHFVSEIIPVPDTVRELKCDGFCYQESIGQFGKKKFLWLRDRSQLSRLKPGMHVDFIVLSGNVKTGIKELAEKLSFERVILTADNSTQRTKKWSEECLATGISCTNLKKDYSYIVSN